MVKAVVERKDVAGKLVKIGSRVLKRRLMS
jgi:hypothetical protein